MKEKNKTTHHHQSHKRQGKVSIMGEVYEDDDHHIATGISLKPVSQKNSGEKSELWWK